MSNSEVWNLIPFQVSPNNWVQDSSSIPNPLGFKSPFHSIPFFSPNRPLVLIFTLSCGALIDLILCMLPFYLMCAMIIVNSFWRKCLVEAPFPSLNYLLFRKCLVLKASLALFSFGLFKIRWSNYSKTAPNNYSGLRLECSISPHARYNVFSSFPLVILSLNMFYWNGIPLTFTSYASKPILSFCFSAVTHMLFAYYCIMHYYTWLF